MPQKNLWESAVLAAQEKPAALSRKPKTAEFQSEQWSLLNDSALFWHGQLSLMWETEIQEGCQSQTLCLHGLKAKADRDLGAGFVNINFTLYKIPSIYRLLHPWMRTTINQSSSWRLKDSRFIQVRPKENSLTLILGKYKTKYSDINTHTHIPQKG